MTKHDVYLILGSNIAPEANLPRALALLAEYGKVRAVSGAWESHAVGSEGPNFLNASVLIQTEIEPADLKVKLVQPIEDSLGRLRTADKNAPRTIDVDVMMVDQEPSNLDRWDHAFVLLPISELMPNTPHPLSGKALRDAADEARRRTWIVPRPDLLKPTT
jgi:2-amino-4-hydroxy-6-hydroxymethyldihydropteridine diphosphokinase